MKKETGLAIVPSLIIGASFLATAISMLVPTPAHAEEVQDMSDPLAVYTQMGAGVTNKGLNLKLGRAYDTGNKDTMAMDVVELKGFAGESLGLDGNDSVNQLHYRHFGVNIQNGRGSQVDVNWDFNANIGTASYSLIQALPQMGPVNLYPLAGIGAVVQDGKEDSYQMPGTFGLAGIYSKVQINERVWLNYNPMYTSQLGGNTALKEVSMFGWAHEAAANYQISPRQNIRLFWNWGETINGTDFRIEYNHQL